MPLVTRDTACLVTSPSICQSHRFAPIDNARSVTWAGTMQNRPARLSQDAIAGAHAIAAASARTADSLRGAAVALARYGHADQAVAAVRDIDDADLRADGFQQVFALVPEGQQERMLHMLELEEPNLRAAVLSRVATHLPLSLLPEAQRITRAIPGELSRSDIWCSLAPRMAELGCWEDAEKATLLTRGDVSLARAICGTLFPIYRRRGDQNCASSAC